MDNKRKILVIEDNKDVLDSIMSILEYSGYASKGLTRFNESMFEMLNTERFSLIILDVMLSGNDGRELVEKFKTRQATKDVPIIMISAYPNVEYSARMAGADGFIQKPFGIDDLLDKVEEHVKSDAEKRNSG